MDGREGMASYYLNSRGTGVGGGPGSGQNVGPGSGGGGGGGGGNQSGVGMPSPPPGYKSLSNPNISVQSNFGSGAPISNPYQVESVPPNYQAHGNSISMASSVPASETVKKKRGRPRKYAPDGSGEGAGAGAGAGGGASMQLALSPGSPGSLTPGGTKKHRGRPPGSGWKQRLAPLGDWMNSTAGLAFTPHVIQIDIGEDIAGKILAFAQQKPRALCILSANGSVSVVTLRQPTTSGGTVTYEGRFEILCLSGSYLVAESGGPRNRTGGLSVSISSPDGHVIGGAIGGKLVASSPTQVVVCSFVFGNNGSKGKTKTESEGKDDKGSIPLLEDRPIVPEVSAPSNRVPDNNPGISAWPPISREDMRNPQTEIDLTRG